MAVDYAAVSAAVAEVGMVTRGGFELTADDVRSGADRSHVAVVMIGNIGGAMWPHFRAGETPGDHPLDRWTKSVLGPLAERFGADFVHPSDKPFQPFQRWAQRADDVWQSPIGLLVHREYGLWHAYRGALLFREPVHGLPPIGAMESPCLSCADQPCLSTCPVDAFGDGGYDAAACAGHVRSTAEPDCLGDGCAARRACPVGADVKYGPDQMRFHMEAFVGDR